MATPSPTTTASRTHSRPGTARFRPAPLLLITLPAGRTQAVILAAEAGFP